MSLTQERINEIALECATSVGMPHQLDGRIAKAMMGFLSRIREEQEVYGWHLTSHTMTNFTRHKQTADKYENIPLFTIPPAVPVINVKVEWEGEGVSSVTSLRVVRTEQEDDGSITAVVREYDDCSCKELVDALELLKAGYKIDGGIFKRDFKIVQEALAKHKAAQKIASSL